MMCLDPMVDYSLRGLKTYGGSVVAGQFNDVLVNGRHSQDILSSAEVYNLCRLVNVLCCTSLR